jgi:DNA-binding NarL/FixJ family response regulator
MVERDPLLRVLGEAADAHAALALVRRHQPKVVVMDLRSAEQGELDKIRRVRAVRSGLEVVVLTAEEDDAVVVGALGAGAMGYLCKTAEAETLLETIRRVSLGEITLDPVIAERVATQFAAAPAALVADPHSGYGHLSARELEVLRAASSGRTNREIGLLMGISERTVHSHLVRVFAKLKVGSRVAAVIVAARLGLIRLGASGEKSEAHE